MPIRLEPADPGQDYPVEDLEPVGARAWGDLLWQLYYWDEGLLYDREANSHTFVYDNGGRLIPAHICRGVADVIEAHLDELDPGETEHWAAQIPYWRHCGGFFQRGKRDLESGRKWS